MGKRVAGVTGAVSDSGAWLMSRVYTEGLCGLGLLAGSAGVSSHGD